MHTRVQNWTTARKGTLIMEYTMIDNKHERMKVREEHRGRSKADGMVNNRENPGSKENKCMQRIATWNVRVLKGKEHFKIENSQKTKLEMLEIMETKKKGGNIIQLDNGHIMIHGAVNDK